MRLAGAMATPGSVGGLSEEEADAWDVMDSITVGGSCPWTDRNLARDPHPRSSGTLAGVPGLTDQTELRCTFQSEIHRATSTEQQRYMRQLGVQPVRTGACSFVGTGVGFVILDDGSVMKQAEGQFRRESCFFKSSAVHLPMSPASFFKSVLGC